MSNVIFPDVLLSSPDFGFFDMVLSREDFLAEAERSKKDFGADFKPTYTEWTKLRVKLTSIPLLKFWSKMANLKIRR